MTPMTEAASHTHEPSFRTEPAVHQHDAAMESLRIRYRIRFAKVDLLRWISHRDLARLWERLLRRAGLKLSMTEGFHPKPRVAFPSALALGVESLDEVVEIELAEDLSVSELLQRLCDDQQPGLLIHSVHRLPEGFGKADFSRANTSSPFPTASIWKWQQHRSSIYSASHKSHSCEKTKRSLSAFPTKSCDLR